jgi:hypothetical protein
LRQETKELFSVKTSCCSCSTWYCPEHPSATSNNSSSYTYCTSTSVTWYHEELLSSSSFNRSAATHQKIVDTV